MPSTSDTLVNKRVDYISFRRRATSGQTINVNVVITALITGKKNHLKMSLKLQMSESPASIPPTLLQKLSISSKSRVGLV